jgi:site-specific recombinase XerD
LSSIHQETHPCKNDSTGEKHEKKLLDRVCDAIRRKHYSIRTEEAYVSWIERFILFHNVRHPLEMGVPEVEDFLTHLAVDKNVAASTQNQALSALLFLYQDVLGKDLERSLDVVRANRPCFRCPKWRKLTG